MSSARKNYLYQLLYELLAILIPLITAPYITRTLGAERLGVYTFAFSVSTFFVKVAALGIRNHGSRSIASLQNSIKERSIVFWSIYCIQFIAASFVLLVFIVYVIFFVQNDKLIMSLQIIYISSSFFNITWFYMGMENFKKTVIRDSLVKILSFVLIFIFVHDKDDLWKYAIIVLGSTLLGQITLWIGVQKYIQFVRPKINTILNQVKPVLVMFIPTVAVTIYTLMDKIMLGAISGKTSVAYYQYASNIVSIPLSFITSFGMVMLPRMSALRSSKDTNVSSSVITQKSIVFIEFLACAFCFGICSISNELIPIYYGTEFIPCIPLLVLLSIKLPFISWGDVVRTQVLIPEHKDKEYIVSLFTGAGINLVFNSISIPKYGAIGASIGTIIAELSVCIVQSYYSNKYIKQVICIKYSTGFALIGLLMLLLNRWIKNYLSDSIFTLIIMILFGATVYISLSFIYYSVVIIKSNPLSVLKDAISKITHKE